MLGVLLGYGEKERICMNRIKKKIIGSVYRMCGYDAEKVSLVDMLMFVTLSAVCIAVSYLVKYT